MKNILTLYFEKLIIIIVTDMCAFVHAWVIALEYQFLCENNEHIFFHKFQFINQVAIKNIRQFFFDNVSRSVKKFS